MNNKQLERFKKLDTNALSIVSGQGYGAQCVIGTTGMTIVGAAFFGIAGAGAGFADSGSRLHHPARPLRLRQNDHPAHDRRA